MKRVIEICCGSYEDCLNAAAGHADRIELNSALHLGGLTPSIGTLRLAKSHVNLPIICMVRPRGAGFCYTENEYKAMIADAEALLEAGADGLAFGFLNKNGSIDAARTQSFSHLIHSYGKEAVFHRAFDCVEEPYLSMELLIESGIDRLLTSGLQSKAYDGRTLIKELQQRYGNCIQILAGSGVNASNAKVLMQETGIFQVHSSCKAWRNDPTTHRNKNVTYAYTAGEQELCYDTVSVDLVKKLVQSI